jgi:hypothetical protein
MNATEDGIMRLALAGAITTVVLTGCGRKPAPAASSSPRYFPRDSQDFRLIPEGFVMDCS